MATFQVRKILFPTDFSACSDAALDALVALASQMKASITAAHVVHVPEQFGPYEAWVYDRLEVEQAIVKETRAHLESYVKEKIPSSIPADGQVLTGPPDLEITALAKNGGYDLIVMGTHGRGGVSHLLMGSVAEKVMRRAPCPVLTVRPQH
jgi:nucleotide-binding universal stress UspA family protein